MRKTPVWSRLARASRLAALALWLGLAALHPPSPAHALTLSAATETELSAAITAVNAAGADSHTISPVSYTHLTLPTNREV